MQTPPGTPSPIPLYENSEDEDANSPGSKAADKRMFDDADPSGPFDIDDQGGGIDVRGKVYTTDDKTAEKRVLDDPIASDPPPVSGGGSRYSALRF